MKLPGIKAGFILPLLIFFITVVVAFINYVPGTWLTGWDTLHPEFNFPAQLGQIFFGVWRADQGLGAVVAHSHMAELPRVLLLWLGSLFLPLSDLRYAYVLACFVLGPLGVYFFLKNALANPAAAFLGSLFYIFNLGTIQHFYVPFEMFPTQYAALGWLFLFAFRGNLKFFVLATLLALPMAYASLLWYAYFAALVLFILILRPRWGGTLIAITLIINAFWLLPNWYFLFTHAKDVPLAKINQMFSDQAFLKNKEFGNLADTAIFKNFLFDWEQNAGGGKSEDLMIVWKNHLNSFWIVAIGYVAAVLVAGGVIVSIKQRKKVFIALLPAAVIALVMIINMNPPFGWFFGWLRDISPVLRESLRFPFTKFSLILMFAAACYFAVFWEWFLTKIRWVGPVVIVVAFGLIVYGWPVFRGFLIDPAMRLSIPQEYFQTFEWFNRQPADGRIAPFPVDSTAGWEYTSWGYQGAGFFWFGVKQSFLARDFDRWMPANENYYWEISQAVYSKNLPLLESVLDKYRVNWLLVDENIVNPSSPKALYFDELKNLITNSSKIKPAAKFGKISVYSHQLQVPTGSYISLVQNLPNIGPTYKWGNVDQAYVDYGDYKNVSGNNNSIAYPYRTLFTGRSQADLEFDPARIPTSSGSVAGGPIIEIAPLENVLTSRNGETKSLSWDFPVLSQREGYLIQVVSKNITGKPLLFWAEDLNSRHAALESYLSDQTSYFVLPPSDPYGLGYTLHVDNISIGKQTAVNQIESVAIYKIDYWNLVRSRIGQTPLPSQYSDNFIVEHPNPALYRIDSNTNGPATLILAQSYEPGWVALGAQNHILINNWANGWTVEGGPRVVYLFFWPQLLEFAGFGLLGVLLIYLTIRSRGDCSEVGFDISS